MVQQRLPGQPNLTPRSSALLPVRITTARRPDHIRLSALVRSRSTEFIVHASSQLGHGPPKRGHFSAILVGSSVRLVSFRILVISACSWPSQHSYFFRLFWPALVIIHPPFGSRHVVRPSIVMILVSSTRSSNTCNESRILTKPPAGISWSRNQFIPITSGVS